MMKSTATILKSKAYDILLHLYDEKYPLGFADLLKQLQPLDYSKFSYHLTDLKNKSLIIQRETRYTKKRGYIISPVGRNVLDKIKLTLQLIPSLDEITENKRRLTHDS